MFFVFMYYPLWLLLFHFLFCLFGMIFTHTHRCTHTHLKGLWDLFNLRQGGNRKSELSSCMDFILFVYLFIYFLSFCHFLGPLSRHMVVLRLGVELELRLLAYATTTAMPDLSCVCNLYCSLQQCWILNPLCEARNRTHILTDTMSCS